MVTVPEEKISFVAFIIRVIKVSIHPLRGFREIKPLGFILGKTTKTEEFFKLMRFCTAEQPRKAASYLIHESQAPCPELKSTEFGHFSIDP